ncbi:MAG: tRNA (adenosine(37)-N6)-threonylcarbamoyltransferase complex ATPase subunit type 1 TsaE [Candidatus Saccharibacteria bacterium]|nr:tRNA (adenosine(37)-N6)-threonylcarbamoyltransferase complex ATPase subunit type 1 TsaE [Candidatus Saccharibacteria bacterium]
MKVIVTSESDMQNLGAKLAKKLPSGSVVELIGDVGAGKTTLVKGVGKGLNITDTIQSPSYTIFCRYDSGDKSLHHYDFYRLNDPGLISYDLDESLHTENTVTLIEWSDHVKDVLPENHVTVNIKTTGENSREVEIIGAEV